ncbi:FHA domain-containing protein [Solimicrobium silvestre]|uniref:FHA domain n=1 Tax=Solimicrobium silvestre TaxID=2099400 RepID=A0A2S9GTG3_9BURK|nr:FHA domain-containing protein [Solimicrobium silvestre]PRC91003.1 FHA domain [Solimicrobium silvestre]
MAKISVTLEGAILQEIPINKVKITIGRRPSNDVVLNHLAISGEHAVIETHSNDSFLEDLNSTNGTQVNGQPVKRHFLQNGDVISLAKYKLRFEMDGMHHVINSQFPDPNPVPGASVKHAFVKVLNGSNAGRQLVLSKELTTLGTPGVQVATITRTNNTYFLTHVEGAQSTLVNDAGIGNKVRELKQGDVIDLSGTRLMFQTG